MTYFNVCSLFHSFRAVTFRVLQSNKCTTSIAQCTADKPKWNSVIGLEIHAQISSATKLFSRSKTDYGKPVNSQVSIFDCALPGTLPCINHKCVECAVSTALALQCEVNPRSSFERKHYFYADLPAGYQITQQRNPVARNGSMMYTSYNSLISNNVVYKTVEITQLQLEQDSGKSLHDEENKVSLIDLNRAGVGLMEIITAPDFVDGLDATAFIKELQLIFETLGTCDGKMAEGSMRVDANISVNRPGGGMGTRTEVKNINSIRNVAKAIDFEICRQIDVLEHGGDVIRETRSFDSETDETVAMRDKETQQDYRFMHEPNLPPLVLYRDTDTIPKYLDTSQIINIDTLQSLLPELPEARRHRLHKSYNISLIQCCLLVNEPILADYFEKTMKTVTTKNCTYVVNVLLNDYLGVLNSLEISFADTTLNAESFGYICDLVERNVISHAIVKKLLHEVVTNPDQSIDDVISLNKWARTSESSDENIIGMVCMDIINDNPDRVIKYHSGKTKVINFFIGRAIKKLPESVDPKDVAKLVKKLLDDKKTGSDQKGYGWKMSKYR